MSTFLSYSDISNICLELALFIHAGAEGGSALSLLAEECDSAKLKASLIDMSKSADDGKKLHEVFSYSGLFPFDVCQMLKVGEETGNLESTLRALSEYYTRRDERDKALRSAILYPSILMLVMAAVMVFLLTEVLPIFNDVYASLGVTLSGGAAFLLKLGESLSLATPLLIAFVCLAVVFLIAFSASQDFRSAILGLDAPKAKGLGKKIYAARFASAMSMAVKSGLSPAQCIDTAAALFPDGSPLAKMCAECSRLTSGGEGLADALRKTELLPAAECSLLALGIKGGNTELSAEEIARRLDRDADEAIDKKVSAAEPIMVIISCLLVGIILLSVMLPLVGIMSAIG